MPRLLLTPESIPLLCQFLMAGVAMLYMLSVPRKSHASRWLAAVLGFGALFSLSYFITTTIPGGAIWQIRFTLPLYVSIVAAMAVSIQLAYTFRARPYRREQRILGVMTAVLIAVLVVGSVWTWVSVDLYVYEIVLQIAGLALILGGLWTLVVNLRQIRRFSQLSEQYPSRYHELRQSAQAHRRLFALTVLQLVLAVINALVVIQVISPLVLQYASLIIELIVYLGLIVIYINHAAEPTSMHAKLVGLGLATVLLFLGITALAVLRPPEIAAAAGNELPNTVSVFAERNDDGSYSLERRPFERASIQGAVAVTPGRRILTLDMPFSFPLGETAYDSLYLTAAAAVFFSDPGDNIVFDEIIQRQIPAMAVFYVPSQPSGPVLVLRRPDRMVLTWHAQDLFARQIMHQLVLYPDGSFSLRFEGNTIPPFFGGVGMHPGPGRSVESVALLDALPMTLPSGVGFLDDYRERYRTYAHSRSLRVALLVLLATAFVLLLFPVFLRSSVLRPLSWLLTGVERVDLGDFDARVPVRTNDELGVVAQAFNRMTGSVQAAEAKLLAYAEQLEERVTERTAELEHQRAELERSLRELTATQNQLVQAEKLAGLGALTAGIAHEIKNPLNFVNNFAQLSVDLADELDEELAAKAERPVADVLAEIRDLLDDLKSNASKIHEHGQRADRIVHGMLLHARGTRGERAPADLNGLLRLASEAAHDAFTHHHPDGSFQFALDLDPDVGAVSVITESLVQVVVNLLDNAFYAVTSRPSGGDGAPPHVTLSSRRTEAGVEIRVQDEGPGMDPATQARLFEPFFTTKPPGEGTGLGLSLAYDIITKGHGGTFTVESAPGRGATFTVMLPV